MSLTPLEKRVRDSAGEGASHDCDGEEIRAGFIRELMLGHLIKEIDPVGVRILNAKITGELDLDGVTSNTELWLHDCVFDEEILARRARLPLFSLRGSRLPGLVAVSATIDSDLVLQGCEVEGGTISLFGATIGGDLECEDATITNTGGPALIATSMSAHNVYLQGVTATGHTEEAAVTLLGAAIRGRLHLRRATITNTGGPALIATSMSAGDAFMQHLTATGHGRVAVSLYGATISGNLECFGTRLFSREGMALDGTSLTVGGNVFLADGFRAGGSGENACLELPVTRITGALMFRDAQIRAEEERGLNLGSASAGPMVLDLDMFKSGGEVDDPETWQDGGDVTVDLDGFVYSALDVARPTAASGATGPGPKAPEILLGWIRRRAGNAYAAQPYQRLAAYHRASGHETEARTVLIAQQDDALAKGVITGRFPRLRHRLFGLLLGYGYQTWRCLVALTGVVALAIGLGLAAGHTMTSQGTYVSTRPGGRPCSTVEQIGVGVERGLPVINTGIRERCDFDTVPVAGQVYTAAGWALQVTAWVLAAMLLAGSTGLIRRASGPADTP